MADCSENTNKHETLSKGVAKRTYLLLDGDLEGLEFEIKDNPVNKSYGWYGSFKISENILSSLQKLPHV